MVVIHYDDCFYVEGTDDVRMQFGLESDSDFREFLLEEFTETINDIVKEVQKRNSSPPTRDEIIDQIVDDPALYDLYYEDIAWAVCKRSKDRVYFIRSDDNDNGVSIYMFDKNTILDKVFEPNEIETWLR